MIRLVLACVAMASLAFFAGYRFGILADRSAGGRLDEPPVVTTPLFEFDGVRYAADSLPQEARDRLVRARERTEDLSASAAMDFYREQVAVARAHLFERYVQDEARRQVLPQASAEAKVLRGLWGEEKVDDEAARALFDATQPGASTKEFLAVREELKAYLRALARKDAIDGTARRLIGEGRAHLLMERPSVPQRPLRAAGFPSVGQADAALTVVNFTDYLCEHCSSFNVALANVVERFKSEVNFVFLPLSFTRPDRGVGLARGAICAHRVGDFLEYHMDLVRLGPALGVGPTAHTTLQERKAGRGFARCFEHEDGVQALLVTAQEEAGRYGVVETPATVFQGELFEGPASAASLEIALSRHLKNLN